MNNWFTVPGQGCPVALGASCSVDLDCKEKAKLYPSCQGLLTGGQGLGWTSSGAVRSSSAGDLRCDPYRKVCTMESYEEPFFPKHAVYEYFTTFYVGYLILVTVISTVFSSYDFLLGVSIHAFPVLVGGEYVVWVKKCCRVKNLSEGGFLALDILFHWLPVLIILYVLIIKNPKIVSKKMFWAGFGSVLVMGGIYVGIEYKEIQEIYNTDPLVLGGIYLGSLALATVPLYITLTR